MVDDDYEALAKAALTRLAREDMRHWRARWGYLEHGGNDIEGTAEERRARAALTRVVRARKASR